MLLDGWSWPSVSSCYVLNLKQTLLISKGLKERLLAWIGHAAFSGQFGQQDPKRPDVRFNGEAAVQSSLGGRPLDGKLGSCKGTRYN